LKKEVSELAVFGGNPAFSEKLHVGRPNIGDRQRLIERIDELLDRRWLTNNGPFVREFEEKLKEMLGVRHCIPVCNATVALEIAIRAMDLRGEVLVPSFTFVATAHALQWQEITPVFCDVDPKTHNIDPEMLEVMVTPKTTGIIGVHVWGQPCNIEAISEIARRRKLKVLYDAAHAFGNSYNGKMIGNYGDAEVFSFHGTKFFNTFEGGAIATNDDDLALKIRLMKNFGFYGYDNVIYIGTNGKMSEVSAAMGLTGLESIDHFIETNRQNYNLYRTRLKDLPGIRFVSYDEKERNNFQYIIMEVDEAVSGISRNRLVEILHAENVLARRYFYPACHKMEPYSSHFPHAGLLLPQTEKLVEKVMSLPNGTGVSQDEITEICNIIQLVLTHPQEVIDFQKTF